MPLTPDLRKAIDQIREYLFGGGYPDPVSNAEQLSFLFFFYLAENVDTENRISARLLNQPYESLFVGDWRVRNPLNAEGVQNTMPRDRLRWSQWARGLSGESLVRFLRDEVFAFFAEEGEAAGRNFMEGARLCILDPTVLTQVVRLVDGLRLDLSNADVKGDLFEHVLRKIRQAGQLGQFRTPRHVIRTIVEILDPKLGETVYDPAAGTAGFLVAAYNHIRLVHSSPAAIQEVKSDGKWQRRGRGDQLTRDQLALLRSGTFFGDDVDPRMVRLASMSLSLNGLPRVGIQLRNVLTRNPGIEERERLGLPPDGHDVILANPPFAGRVDKDRILEEIKIGSCTATELLFLKYIVESLRDRGRCGVVVPEGVLFGATSAHKELRRQLIENNSVEAILSLPGGVFLPYSGVKTSVLIFRKGGRTDKVLFLHADNDGYKLDANHDQPIEADDLPSMVAAYRNLERNWATWASRDAMAEWNEKWWFVDAVTLSENDFNLSAGRYRPMRQAMLDEGDPKAILEKLSSIGMEIAGELEALRVTLAEAAG